MTPSAFAAYFAAWVLGVFAFIGLMLAVDAAGKRLSKKFWGWVSGRRA